MAASMLCWPLAWPWYINHLACWTLHMVIRLWFLLLSALPWLRWGFPYPWPLCWPLSLSLIHIYPRRPHPRQWVWGGNRPDLYREGGCEENPYQGCGYGWDSGDNHWYWEKSGELHEGECSAGLMKGAAAGDVLTGRAVYLDSFTQDLNDCRV